MLRFGRATHRYEPGAIRALPSDFELSTADRKAAEETGRPALLSVFERSRTSVPEARAITGKADAAVFQLMIEQVVQLPVPGQGEKLAVRRDPLAPPADQLPGADGHCGIQGLNRPSSVPRAHYKELRSQLADLATTVA